ncbi:MAG: glycerate-2-kinase family protein [Acidobacteria bacterium]|nr:glycerate-2-kinase family protein [Acidobacteriota bacterium]
MRAGIDRAAAYRLLTRAIADNNTRAILASRPLHLVAAGKASHGMITALANAADLTIASALAVGTQVSAERPPTIEWLDAGHPLPDERSVAAGVRALAVARRVLPHEHLLLLLSGGASALLAAPLEGLRLEDKQRVIRLMLHRGADIHALNTVRKHMSAIKGGRLAAACQGTTWTLAISDVVGDDLSTIGSGPGVPDTTTWQSAFDLLNQYGAGEEPVHAVADLFRRGIAGEIPDTPGPDDPEMARIHARVIGGRADAVEGARLAAEARGYHVVALPEPVIGEARTSGNQWIDRLVVVVAGVPRPLCVLSAGETRAWRPDSHRPDRHQRRRSPGAASRLIWTLSAGTPPGSEQQRGDRGTGILLR